MGQKKIYFPNLHPELVDKKNIDQLIFIEPGIREKYDPSIFYRPKQFPLDEVQCKKYINELLMYGDFFKNPKEIKQGLLLQILDKDQEKITAIKSQIKTGDSDSNKVNFYLLAQTTLLLLWFLEEKIIELEKIDSEINEDLKKLSQILDEESKNDWNVFLKNNKTHIFDLLPIEKLLPWFFLVMDKGDVLIVESLELLESWIDFGIEFNDVSDSDTIKISKDVGWRYVFKKRPDDKMSWLNREYTVYFIGEENK